MIADPHAEAISPKIAALLDIATLVQRGGKAVDQPAVDHACSTGASDAEIHDTVLIAAAFCMFNRYVDGLATWQPTDRADYAQTGAMIVEHGYAAATPRPH